MPASLNITGKLTDPSDVFELLILAGAMLDPLMARRAPTNELQDLSDAIFDLVGKFRASDPEARIHVDRGQAQALSRILNLKERLEAEKGKTL